MSFESLNAGRQRRSAGDRAWWPERAAALEASLHRVVSTWSSDRAVITLPAPKAFAVPEGAAVALRTSVEDIVGCGAAVEFRADGPDRMAELAGLCRFESEMRGVDGAVPFDPLFLGGVAFESEPAQGRWRAFGAARFFIPRWTWRSGPAPVLQLVLTAGEDRIRAQADAVVREYRALVEIPAPLPAPTATFVRTDDDYERDVAGALRTIAAGLADKIVLSRDLVVDGTFRDAAVFERLDAGDALATFLFRADGASFVGATPERLVAVDGVHVRSEAVAGSAPATDPHALATDKNRREHEAVVAWIRSKLTPIASCVDAPREPTVRRLPHVHHFVTPIDATLPEPRHVLDVAASLFPTPAVAGTPLEYAKRVIRETERRPRGWYAGAIGAFDTQGRGALYVALRCALLEGRRATVFAGAGIVAGSEPAVERRETEAKARTMLTALGVVL